ncbi:MAG: hypothetical protein Q8K75_11645 [Chlamydiales bacterium]|nr:hypothetical protein [Chlamydiales bacterium]
MSAMPIKHEKSWIPDSIANWLPASLDPRNDPKWFSDASFTSNTTLREKTCRIGNQVVFAGSLFGAYTLATGGTGLPLYFAMTAMALACRKFGSATIGYLAYPIALVSLSPGNYLQRAGRLQADVLTSAGFKVQTKNIYKSGTGYNVALIAKPGTLRNQAWSIHALGNGMAFETSMADIARENHSRGFNTLIINGPSVGESGGWPTRYQLGAGYEAGLQFLEQGVKANRICMQGFSLGGGMMAEGILHHDFKFGIDNGIRYQAIFNSTFASLRDIAGALIGRVVTPILYATGTDLDVIAACKHLDDLNIPQIVLQHTHDDIIPAKVSLANKIQEVGLGRIVNVIKSGSVRRNAHNSPFPWLVNWRVALNMMWFKHGWR